MSAPHPACSSPRQRPSPIHRPVQRPPGQPERLTTSMPGQLLKAKLAVVQRRPHRAGRIEVHGEPTPDRAHSRQEAELAPHDLPVQVHGDAFDDEECRSCRVESVTVEGTDGIVGGQISLNVGGPRLRCPVHLVQPSRQARLS